MDVEQLKFLLQDLKFSAALPAETLGQLAAAASVQPLPAGELVFREGATTDRLYLVHSGKLALEMSVPGRGPVRILTVGPGEMVGWSSLLGQGRMTASAIAVEDSVAIVSAAARLCELCESDATFGFHLMRQMANALSKRLVATRLQLLDLFADSPQAAPVSRAKEIG